MIQKTAGDWRRERVASLKKHHKPTFDAMGIDPYFTIKSTLFNDGKKVVLMYPSEVERRDDIYFELVVMKENTPIDDSRTLYKYNGATDYSKYPKVVKSASSGEQYAIPMDEMEVVKRPEERLSESVAEAEFNMRMEIENMPLERATFRDVACCLLQVPETQHEWLNDLIRKSLDRNKF